MNEKAELRQALIDWAEWNECEASGSGDLEEGLVRIRSQWDGAKKAKSGYAWTTPEDC